MFLRAIVDFHSVGPRSCLGEALVRMELKLFYISILQRYEVKPVPGIEVSFASTDGLVHLPLPQKLLYIPRK